MERWRWGVTGALVLPGAMIVADLLLGRLGANPVEAMIHQSGLWALRLTLFTITLSCLARWWRWCHPLHRLTGLSALAYAGIHLLLFIGLEQGFSLAAVIREVIKRPYVTLGMTALLLLILQALTVWPRIRRALGSRFAIAHRLVYLAALAGVGHWLWLVKADWRPPMAYGLVWLGLVAVRLNRVNSG